MKDGFESLGRVRAQGLALLLLAFVVGILGGMALERLRTARRAPRPPAEWPGMRPGMSVMPAIFERLNLSEEQRARIEHIMRESRPLTDSVLQASLPRLRAIRDSVWVEIRAVLTPEQQERFDAFERRRGDRTPGDRGTPMGPGERGRRGGPGARSPEGPPPDSR
jgi:Spy/CpxP family protein refolding chaperone